MSEDKSDTLGRCENAVMADPRRWAGHEGPHKYKPDCMHWTPLPSSEGTVKSPDRCPRCGSLEKPFLSLKCASVNENSHPWHHQSSVPLKSPVSTNLGFSEGLPVLPKPVPLKSETVPTKPKFDPKFMDNMRNTAKKVRENPEIYGNFRVAESETVEERAKMGVRITPESDARMNYVVKEINKLAGPREELHEQAKTYWREWIEEARDDWPSIVPISLMFDFAAAFASSLLQEKEQRIGQLEAEKLSGK